MKKYKKYVIGDIHGAYKALCQCLEAAAFDYKNDMLICLGDVCDGWPEVKSSVNEIFKIKNLIYILGNHDYWTLEWMTKGFQNPSWILQGGSATIESYAQGVPKGHIQFFKRAKYYYLDDNRLFTHGGFDPDTPLEYQEPDFFLWDRSLVEMALMYNNSKTNITPYKEVYVGHTPTLKFGVKKPFKACEVWMMDTGAGWPDGVLSLMEIETKELFISDPVNQLYSDYKGRGM